MADLVSSTEIKSYLEIGDSGADTLITDLAVYASAAIRTYCDRSFALNANRIERHDGGQLNLMIKEPDINSITSIADLRSTTGSAVTAGAFVTGTTYTIITVGTTDFTAIGAANSVIGTVFKSTGAGSGTGTAYANAVTTAGDYFYEAGRLIYLLSEAKWGSGRQRWQVDYSGGSDTIPNDVKEAALEWIAMRFETKDMAVKSQSLGDQNFTREDFAIVPKSIRVLLAPYRVNQGRY